MNASTKDTVSRTLFVAAVLCVCCSVAVSVAAVLLRPSQERNKLLDRKKNILVAAGLYPEGATASDVDGLFEQVETRLVDFETGALLEEDEEDPAGYDQRDAARDPARGVEIARDRDFGNIKRRAKRGLVYFVRENGALKQLVLPVHGKGLWGTMYAFLALQPDLNTVVGLSFYEHVETPGLGAEVENEKWKERWRGKRLFDDKAEEIVIRHIKGKVNSKTPNAIHRFDGLSGATITTRGVTDLLRYWLGDDAYGPFLKRQRQGKN